ncbi:putative AlkP superfamily pyrophosphatase or phosphodiesterase [Aquimarina sp. EL_43]|uniref:alkaline phosphatase PafA n=1 Tax=unclassified Aquimarina TaxID=2627091 RepID=UPI0018C930BF|nr:alkaline phosphatase PafA [Aquimarina sp. EL_35]MBG6131134.1 putative AlkP superfamily pyrophosphatase or phosphodiesterase [Aquimarina sp. EL_35]MBG6151593.1 putative AlkP superfamily pyrophosphatase or phosphodiesterase [Aquimarina sp. EL_32]MBG6169524.1 putative AlkP superfamily pyrophosphatase or phosphodiesterase [Aquimarina sp. EL_43]
MTKRVFLILLVTLCCMPCRAQEGVRINSSPKLVVGIVVDQMRYDYLTRFYNRFGDRGFKRMINEGFNCKNNHFNYVPTYTGPGHASVYTGTTPKNHGIISNHWYDKFGKAMVYCANDSLVKAVGSNSEMEQMSPRRMKTSTVSDQNRLHTQLKGKTIGIAIKDRGAILPAGHSANGAYWFRGKDEGKWITSTYYRNELPDWVKKFNTSNQAESYLKVWNTLYDINTYTESGPDQNQFEGGYKGKETATFPYDLAKLKDQNAGYDIIKASAYGNSLTTDFAIAAIEGEQLGVDKTTDFLTVSFSSTDYVGHNFGVNSKEIQDTYLRLDKDLERFFDALDTKVGKGQYTVFLTADHGAVHVPSYLKSVKIPAGYFDRDAFTTKVKAFVKAQFKVDGLIENISNNQVFFDYNMLKKHTISAEKLEKALAHYMLQENQIDKVFTRNQLETGEYVTGIAALIQKGFNQKRSGDVVYVMDPATISYSKTGSTHGSGLTYDTHAPLLFFGQGIQKGSTTQETYIPDIAPTISALLGITFPNGATGKVLSFVLE